VKKYGPHRFRPRASHRRVFNSFTSGLLTTALRLPWPFSSVFNYYDLSKHHVISLLVQPDSLRTKMVFTWFTSKPETNGNKKYRIEKNICLPFKRTVVFNFIKKSKLRLKRR